MSGKLLSDIDAAQSKRILELIQTETTIFKGFAPGDLDEILTVLKIVQFKKGERLAVQGEALDFFGLLLYGSLRIGEAAKLTPAQVKQGHSIHYLKIGDMIGHQNLAEQSGDFMGEKWKFDVWAETDGSIAILPFGEIKTEIRRQPKGMFKVLELAANQAYETNYFNITGELLNPTIPFVPHAITLKKVRDFFQKDPVIKTFMQGFDRKDERMLLVDVKGSNMQPGDRVVRRQTKDRSLYFVVSGQFIGLGADYPAKTETYKAGAVIGVHQFLHDDHWSQDIICKEEGILGRYEYSSFDALKFTQPQIAIKIYNRIIRHKCFSLIYDRKNNHDFFTSRMERQIGNMQLEDRDLFVDLKVGSEKKIYNLYAANMANMVHEEFVFDNLNKLNHENHENQPRTNNKLTVHDGQAPFATLKNAQNAVLGKKGDVANNVPNLNNSLAGQIIPEDRSQAEALASHHCDEIRNKGDVYESVPLFLSSTFKEIYNNSKAEAENWQEKLPGKQEVPKAEKRKAKGAAKMYKSEWILSTLKRQQDNVKNNRRNKALAGSSSRQTIDGAGTGTGSSAVGGKPGGKGKGKQAGRSKEEEKDLEVVIEELRGEMEWKEEEFKEMREELDLLRELNKKMRITNKKEVSERQLLEANKRKYTMLKELVDHSGQIQDQSYFEHHRSEKQTTSASMRNQLIEQQRENRKGAIAKKYAMRWLEKVRQARSRRAELEFYHDQFS